MNIVDLIQNLETQWDCDGFLDGIRRGRFEIDDADAFLYLLKNISIGEDERVPKRLMSLLWYLPLFLEWQKERVAVNSAGEVRAYERFVTEVQNVLEEVLGVP